MGEAAARAADPRPGFRRDGLTWAVFGALLAFGFLNAALGPALPFIRAAEHISYLVGALHQAAFAVGGGLAGVFAARAEGRPGRAVMIRAGLAGAGVAGLGIGYGARPVITVAAALLVSLLATSALISLWAVLADVHQSQRAVAMTEGEVAVSLGGVVAPLLVGGLAATTLTWRFAFAAGAVLAVAAAGVCAAVRIPPPAPGPGPRPAAARRPAWQRRPGLTLILVFAIVALEFSLSFWLASYLNDSVGLTRRLAVSMVSGLYAANLGGRLIASRLARHVGAARLLLGAIGVSLAGLPVLLAASDAVLAATGLAVTGAGIGATFPLASSLHVAASPGNADRALGQVLATAAVGQIAGPLAVAAIAQAAGLRIGLLIMPLLAFLAAASVVATRRGSRRPPA